jgi:ABC-type transport system involved in multi-copper enzyme maturation permease subunit
MNATTIVAERATSLAPDTERATLLGLGPLVRKDFREWLRGKRAWITPLIVAPVLALTAANGAISHWIVTNVPSESGHQIAPISLDPAPNFLAAIGTQFVIVAAIFATMSLFASERDSGTLAWTASKPVSRLSIWMSKWITASATLFVAAVLIPVAVTVAVTVVLYGALDPVLVVATIVALEAAVILFSAIGLAAGAYARSQAVVAAVGLGVLFIPSIIGGLWAPLNDFLPTSIQGWILQLGMGQGGSPVTLIAWLASIGLIVAIAARRMRRMEF